MNITVFLSLVEATVSATVPTLNTERIDQLTDLKGKLNEKEGAYKISFPRDEIAVAVDGWKIPAFMGLTTWASFTRATHSEAMVMGDTVLFEDEVNLGDVRRAGKRLERDRSAQPFLLRPSQSILHAH